jgi:hypothetical protein
MATKSTNKLHGLIASMVLALIAGGTALAPVPAHAVFATEATQFLNQINLAIQRAQAYAEYGEEAMRWRQTLAQYQQQLVRIQGIISAFGMPQGPELTPVALNHNVAARCGGFSISSLTKVFNLNGSGNIYDQQKQICANIQMMENMKYNATVEFLEKTASEMKTELQGLDARRGISNENGNIDANTNDAVRMATNMGGKFKVWETQVSSCDAYIETMQETQKILAQGALKGKSGLLGTFVKTAALKGALEVND